MTGAVEFLGWDTDFFGAPMGRVALDDATEASLDRIDAEAAELGIALLVGTLDPGASRASRLVQARGHRLLEVGLTFERPARTYRVPPTTSVARLGRIEDLPALEPALEELLPWGRFAIEPRFGPDTVRRLYHAWIDRAAADGGEEYLFVVTEDEGVVNGFATFHRTPRAGIDLMGVSGERKGSGAAWALMAAGIDWAGEGGALEAGVAAVRNLAIQRYLERGGFRAVRARYLFHRWYDDHR